MHQLVPKVFVFEGMLWMTCTPHTHTHTHAHMLPNHLQVFDVTLNRQHTVISNLDIFSKVGKAAPLDEAIPFAVENDKLVVNGEISDFDGTLTVDFVKV